MKKNNYIKYTKAELDKYVATPESCVNRVKSSEEICIMPWLLNNLQKSIISLLSEKIGKFSNKLDGVVLDFRNTKVLTNTTVVRQDTPSSSLEVETNFYVFSPKKGAVIKGIIKHIGVTNMESNISVVIYRVFNVKITVKGRIPKEVAKNTEIQIKIKDFHFENEIPYIEGEIVDTELFKGKKIIFDEYADSGISESSVTSTVKVKTIKDSPKKITIKQEKEEHSSIVKSSTMKRKMSDDFELPAAKLIKRELFSSQEMASPQIKKERTESSSSQSSTSKKQKSKKSKKNREDSSDDFSQSILEMLDNSAIVTSKAKKQKKTRKTPSSDEDDFIFERYSGSVN
ncbi:unnamed protein product [Diamesa serratosioi]